METKPRIKLQFILISWLFFSAPSFADHYYLQNGMKDAMSGPLNYLGTDVDGDICYWRNSKVMVVSEYCTEHSPEGDSPTVNYKFYPIKKPGMMVEAYIEPIIPSRLGKFMFRTAIAKTKINPNQKIEKIATTYDSEMMGGQSIEKNTLCYQSTNNSIKNFEEVETANCKKKEIDPMKLREVINDDKELTINFIKFMLKREMADNKKKKPINLKSENSKVEADDGEIHKLLGEQRRDTEDAIKSSFQINEKLTSPNNESDKAINSDGGIPKPNHAMPSADEQVKGRVIAK